MPYSPPSSPYAPVKRNPFVLSSFGDQINVRDRKHMSIIDDPACLSPGGKNVRKHTTPYRLSDLISQSSQSPTEQSQVREDQDDGAGGSEVASNPFSPRESIQIGYVAECDDEDGSDGRRSQKVALKTRRTGKSTPNLHSRSSRTSVLSGIRSGSNSSHSSNEDLIAHSDDARSIASSSRASTNDRDSASEVAVTDGSVVVEEVRNSDDGSAGGSGGSEAGVETDLPSPSIVCAAPLEPSGLTPLPKTEDNVEGGLCWLWKTRAFSDLTIACAGQEVQVHKCVLAAQCPHFNELLQNLLEDEHDVLELNDEDPKALNTMLEYLYTGSLTLPAPTNFNSSASVLPTLDTLVKVYELGCKYNLPMLKKDAAEQYTQLLSTSQMKGHALFLAKILVKIFKMAAAAAQSGEQWFADGAEEIKEVTLNVALSCAEELVDDPVAFDLLEGEVLRAFVGRIVKKERCGGCHCGVEVGPGDSVSCLSSGVPDVPGSECSGAGMWQ